MSLQRDVTELAKFKHALEDDGLSVIEKPLIGVSHTGKDEQLVQRGK